MRHPHPIHASTAKERKASRAPRGAWRKLAIDFFVARSSGRRLSRDTTNDDVGFRCSRYPLTPQSRKVRVMNMTRRTIWHPLCAHYCLSVAAVRSAAPIRRPAGGAVASPLGVSVQGWVTPEAPPTSDSPLRSEDALGEGDQFSLRVQLAAPAYLYVLQASPTRLVPLVSGARPSLGCRRTEPPASEDPALSRR